MLHKVDTAGYSKAKRWCGPGALSILTGQPLRESTEQLTRIHGTTYDDMSGAWPEDLQLALHEHGYRTREIDIVARYRELTHGPTLRRFLSERSSLECVMPLLIVVNSHFVTAHMLYAADSWTMGPVPINQFPKPNRHVKQAWVVEKK